VLDSRRPSEWNPDSARVASIYVVDGRPGPRHLDTLDVATLHDLPSALAMPVSRWPHAELRITPQDLHLEPSSFKAGDKVTAVVTVHNVGGESARVRLYINGRPECSDVAPALSPEVSGVIAAGKSMTWRTEIVIPNFTRWYLGATTELLRAAQMFLKYEITNVSKGTAIPIGPRPFTKCSVG
jgi:hypothetical protein